MITAGLDLGSTYVKAVVLKDKRRVGYAVLPTGNDHVKASRVVLEKALEMASIEVGDVEYIVSTGYGRRVTPLAHENISEITANARGVRWLGRKLGVRTIIDIGGQDTKVISLDENGKIANFAMNDKCAAGTGRFLEVLAHVLEIPLDEMGPLSLKSQNPVDITTTCLVFAKTEIARMIFKGHRKEDVVAGIHRSVARRLTAMARRVGVKEVVFFDGGPARNIGMVRALEEELGVKLYIPELPQIVTATGAALIAMEKLEERS